MKLQKLDELAINFTLISICLGHQESTNDSTIFQGMQTTRPCLYPGLWEITELHQLDHKDLWVP